jgi:type II secretory pathway component PulC
MTPEEKLFAIIQRGGSGAPALAARRLSFSPAQLWKRAHGFLTHPRIELLALNRALFFVIGALVLANGLLPVLWRPSVAQITAKAVQQVESVAFDPPLAGLQPAEAYAQIFKEHNPFHVLEPAPVAIQAPAGGRGYADLLKQDFRLVGIVWAEEPIAMIEQVGTGRTYPVKAREPLGQFTVKSVLKDRVVFEINGQELELF